MSKVNALVEAMTNRMATKMNDRINATVEWATVKAVQFEDGTCTVQMDGDAEGQVIEDILVMSVANFKTKPKADSRCLVCHILNDKSAGFLVWCEQIEELHFNGDSFGGIALTKVLAEKLKALEDEVENFKSTFNSHTHICGGSGSPSAPTTSLTTPALLPRTTQDDISSKVIKHGE